MTFDLFDLCLYYLHLLGRAKNHSDSSCKPRPFYQTGSEQKRKQKYECLPKSPYLRNHLTPHYVCPYIIVMFRPELPLNPELLPLPDNFKNLLFCAHLPDFSCCLLAALCGQAVKMFVFTMLSPTTWTLLALALGLLLL